MKEKEPWLKRPFDWKLTVLIVVMFGLAFVWAAYETFRS